MKEIPAFQAPFLAFYSGDLYRDVARRWGGIGMCYLLLLTFCSLTVSNTIMYFTVNKYVESIVDRIPELSVKDNKLSLLGHSPYILDIEGENGKKAKFVFDTSGKVTTLKEAQADLLVTADAVIIKDTIEGEKTTTLAEIFRQANPPDGKMPDLTLTKDMLAQFKTTIKQCVVAMMVGLTVIFMLGHFILSLIYGAMGCIMASITEANLGYGACTRLAAVAMTPSILISTLMSFGGASLLQFALIWSLLTIPLTLGYIYFACASAAKSEA